MFVKYSREGLAKKAFFIGFNAYAVLTALIIYVFVTILLEQEIREKVYFNKIYFQIGLEPMTIRLTVERLTVDLLESMI
jgi:hypothetical protein